MRPSALNSEKETDSRRSAGTGRFTESGSRGPAKDFKGHGSGLLLSHGGIGHGFDRHCQCASKTQKAAPQSARERQESALVEQ
jgi:hypothetical protein